MAKISAAQVKELRDKTGVGMMDAKKALVAVEAGRTRQQNCSPRSMMLLRNCEVIPCFYREFPWIFTKGQP